MEHGCPFLLATVLEALPVPVPSRARLLRCPEHLYPSAGTAGPCVPAGQEQVTSALAACFQVGDAAVDRCAVRGRQIKEQEQSFGKLLGKELGA